VEQKVKFYIEKKKLFFEQLNVPIFLFSYPKLFAPTLYLHSPLIVGIITPQSFNCVDHFKNFVV